jgi:hypothetical protein
MANTASYPNYPVAQRDANGALITDSPRYDANGVLITDSQRYANGSYHANGVLQTTDANGSVVILSGPQSGRANATHDNSGNPRFAEVDIDGNHVDHPPVDRFAPHAAGQPMDASNTTHVYGTPFHGANANANGQYANGSYANGQSYGNANTYVNAAGQSVTNRRVSLVNTSAFVGATDRRVAPVVTAKTIVWGQ